MSLHDTRIAFIGGGNMARAIIGGLLSSKMDAGKICVAEPWDVNRTKMEEMGVRATASNLEAASGADLVLLSVKPQVVKSVCEELAASWAKSESSKLPVIVSIAAGITLDSLKSWLRLTDGRQPHAVRVMPNTPALVGEGASGIYADSDVRSQEKDLVTQLMASVSKVVEWVDSEDLLNVVTGLSGSGPAYFFNLVEHLVTSATSLGLPEDQARRLAIQTCAGAGKMLVESPDSPEQLRKNVTSPNGTTHAALETFKAMGLAGLVDEAVKAASNRADELGRA